MIAARPADMTVPGELTTKAWTCECAKCRRQTSVTAGTLMHGSKLPLTVWFWAAYLMATHSNSLSARQMWRQLGLGSYKSAWLLYAKLRRAMVNPARALLLSTPSLQCGWFAQQNIGEARLRRHLPT